MKISVIIPVFNEEKYIKDCIDSLEKQSFKDIEIICIDDGSTDSTIDILNVLRNKYQNLKLLSQKHLGPAEARNLGAKESKSSILVFVDADMIFDKDFVKNLVKPILDEGVKGTFSKKEFLLNKENIWSRCWNINKALPQDKMHQDNYPDTQPVFRAILKKDFEKANGFSSIGYVDDYTLSDKLGFLAVAAPNAIFYHRNPETLKEVFEQARWIGKSEYKKRKIKSENIMRLVSLIRYSLPFSLVFGLIKSFQYHLPRYLLFKIIYDFAVEVSLFRSFFKEQLYK